MVLVYGYLEPTLFRRFFISTLLTESYGESVASGVWQNEQDSKLDTLRLILKTSHHRPHDAYHVADQLGP